MPENKEQIANLIRIWQKIIGIWQRMLGQKKGINYGDFLGAPSIL